MIISFSPMRRDDTLEVSRVGEVLTINGEAFDFSGLPAGSTIPAGEVPCDWITGPIDRDDAGTLRITLILPHGANPPYHVAFPASLVSPANGIVPIPSQGEADVDA